MALTLIIIACVLILFIVTWSNYKCIKAGNLTMICGGVKTGKSQLSVREVFRRYNCARAGWKFKMLKYKLTSKKKKEKYNLIPPEEPLLYSNVPIGKKGFSHLVPLSYELLTCQQRFAYKSVIYICEASLVNNCMDIKDEDVNDVLQKLYKLIAHETQGGYMYIDTQNPLDVHFGPKRSLSTYYHIYKRTPIKLFGYEFFSIIHLREMMLNAGDKSEEVKNEDPQDAQHEGTKGTYWHIIGRKWFKYYDRYCYSALTDHLPVANNTVTVGNCKKAKNVLQIKNYIRLKKQLEKEAKDAKKAKN